MTDIDAMQQWLAEVPGGAAEPAAEAWAEFTRHSLPLVTLFGSYDTGKSSLLRRLLVDSDAEVPNWLTISARHETFDSNEIELGDCIIRDTPGFAVGATDARSQNNSRRAATAVELTDIGIAVLTPQLVTADRELFTDILAKDWPAGTLWFVISRFDEAGVDAESDPSGYQALRERKINELRELFQLDAAVPVFVVAQDPYQMAGPDNDVTKSLWADFHSWDGVGALTAALSELNADTLGSSRDAAGRRYWTHRVKATVRNLRKDLDDCRENARVAAHGVARRDGWESELAALDDAALASLDGLVESVIDQWSTSPQTSPNQVQTEVETSLTDWFMQHDVQLQRLRRTITKTAERDRRQPSWKGFSTLLAQLTGTGGSQAAPGSPLSEQVDTAGHHVIDILKVLDDVGALDQLANRAGRGKSAAAANRLSGQGYVEVAEAVLPLALYVAKAIDDHRADPTPNGAGNVPSSSQTRQRVIDACTDQAHTQWAEFVESTRALIDEQTADQVALNEELRRTARQLEATIAEGEALTGQPRPTEQSGQTAGTP